MPPAPSYRSRLKISVSQLLILWASSAYATAPANDDISGAVTFSTLPLHHSQSTIQTTVAADDPGTSCFGPTATVWYAFTASASGEVAFDTQGSDFDTKLAAFTGSPSGRAPGTDYTGGHVR